MIDGVFNLWAYWHWFLTRQSVKGANNQVQNPYGLKLLSALIPTIGGVSILTILLRTIGRNLTWPIKNSLLCGFGILILFIGIKGSRRGELKKEEFEAYDKKLVSRYDFYVWIFALSCIAAFVLMGVIGQ